MTPDPKTEKKSRRKYRRVMGKSVQAVWQEKKLAEGKCAGCGGSRGAGHYRCARCNENRRALQRRASARYRAKLARSAGV